MNPLTHFLRKISQITDNSPLKLPLLHKTAQITDNLIISFLLRAHKEQICARGPRCQDSRAYISKKDGKDLATQSSSSMMMGLSAPSAATFSAITILWS